MKQSLQNSRYQKLSHTVSKDTDNLYYSLQNFVLYRIPGHLVIWFACIFLVCLNLPVLAQDINLYPTELNTTINGCNGKSIQTFRIENNGAKDLIFTISKVSAFDAPNAGITLESQPLSSTGIVGIVLVGNFMYSINYSTHTLLKYDTTSKKLTASYALPIAPYGITYDGTQLWIGQYSTNKIFSYDLSGNATGSSMTMPVINPAFTYDDHYFIVAAAFTSNPAIYVIDHSGNIVKSYGSTGIGSLYNITWVPEHSGGNLWATDNGYYYRQINLSGSDATVKSSFYFNTGTSDYSFAHNGTDFFTVDWLGNFYRFSDGIDENPDWLALSAYSGTVPSGSAATIAVTFDAAQLSSGNYGAIISINSNDPLNYNTSVNCNLTFVGDPLINLSTSNLELGAAIVGTTLYDTLWISNPGCETLTVFDISGSTPEFFHNITNINILPGDSAALIIGFTPGSADNYNTTLVISNNDEPVTLNLSGIGIEPPVMTVTPDTISASLSCGGNTTKSFSIANSGTTNLIFAIDTAASKFPVGTLLDEYMNFVNNSHGIVWIDGYIYVVYTEGNTLYKYNPVSQTIVGSYAIHNGASGIVYDGNYLWIGSSSGIVYNYTLSGISGGLSFRLPFNGYYSALGYDGKYFITAPCYFDNTNIYKVDHSGNIIETYSSDFNINAMLWVPSHKQGNLWISNIGNLLQVKLSGGLAQILNDPGFYGDITSITHNGTDLWYAPWTGNLFRIDDGINENCFVKLSNLKGSINPGSSATITATVAAGDLGAGTHNVNLLINSNDPSNAIDTVSFRLTINGSPSITLSSSSVAFDNSFPGITVYDTVWISNNGCDTLKITGINSSSSAFAADKTSFFILPDNSESIIISFAPGEIKTFNDTLTILSNIEPTKVYMSGTGIAAPAMSVNPESLSISLNCQGAETRTFTITNNGTSNLSYSIPKDFSNIGRLRYTYHNGVTGNERGMVLVGNYLYIADYNNYRLIKYSLTTQSVETTYNLSFEPYGIVYDGQYLWIGDYSSGYAIRAYDLSMNSIGISISLPVYNPVLAYDGTNFIVSSRWSSNPLIYKIDHSGNILATYSSGFAYLEDFTWAKGYLWAVDNAAELFQLNLSGSSAAVVNSFAFNYDVTALVYDKKDFLCSDQGSDAIYRISGIYEGLSLSVNEGTVIQGSPETITATFDADSNAVGTYFGQILVNSNDPSNSSDTVEYTLTISGAPEMSMSSSSLAFGSIFTGRVKTDTIKITNNGCDTLKITGISGITAGFTINMTNFFVMPYSVENLIISFAPSTIGGYNATLAITSNDGNPSVSLSGVGIAPPSATITASVDASVNVCGGSIVKSIAIGNTGGSALTYDFTDVPDWITLSQLSGTVSAGGNINVSGTFNATELNRGIYYGTMEVNTNDPINPVLTVNYSFAVDGDPTIVLSNTTVSFPPTIINTTPYSGLTLTNTGCDTLIINSVSCMTGIFDVSPLSLNVPPGQSKTVIVYFTPTSIASYIDTLTINSNVNVLSVPLSGTGTLPKVVEVTTYTANGYYNEGKTIEMAIRFNAPIWVNNDFGNPQISLNTTPVASASWVNGSGTHDLQFNYIVGADENSADLDYTATTALILNGAILLENTGNLPDSILPTVGTFAALYDIVIDNIDPTVEITSTAADSTPQNPIEIIFTFSERVQKFKLSDLIVTNGTIINLQTTNNIVWYASLIPAANGRITIDIASGDLEDLAGNQIGTVEQFVIVYDNSLPLLTITSSKTSPVRYKPIPVTVTSNVPVTGLELTDFVVTNGSASNFVQVTEGISWSVDITPVQNGTVTVVIPANSVINGDGRGNPESSRFSIVYQRPSGMDDVISEPGILVYPNPVSSFLKINIENTDAKVWYSMYSITGAKLCEGPVENGEASLDMESWKPNIYILNINDGIRLRNFKIIKK